ncbi:hypothetical protein M758_8G165000 [Ceratodon purpureus]|nr:hypothetical protein M758_8G165000 [Ceratodon purpureus]
MASLPKELGLQGRVMATSVLPYSSTFPDLQADPRNGSVAAAAHSNLALQKLGGRLRINSKFKLRQRLGSNNSDRSHGFGERLGANPSLASSALCGAGKSRVTMMQTSRTSEPFDLDGDSAAEIVETGVNWFSAFWRFTRPHTIIGSGLGVTSVSLLAMESISDLNLKFVVGLLKAVIPALCMNVYIVGLNQLYDIEIDKVNKPNLPLASGEFSVATGIALVTTFAVASVAMGVYVGSPPLLWALLVSLVLGTAYSADMPFLRWKRSALAAASCILAVRAVVVQLGFYLHMQVSVLGRPAVLSKPLLFATGFMCFFSIVIALAKDIPDVEGDKVYGIRSFSVRLGQKRVFWMCVALLETAYIAAIVTSLTAPTLASKVITCLGHAMLGGVLWERSQSVDLKSRPAITSWYMFIWKLFYAEYFLIPFMR